jgi:hypothetical protein
MKPEHIEDVLVHLHSGQWFGWSDSKNKVYENLVIHSDDEKPTKEWLESELSSQQAAWDSDKSAKESRLESVKTKLEALGLTTEEVKDAFGL